MTTMATLIEHTEDGEVYIDGKLVLTDVESTYGTPFDPTVDVPGESLVAPCMIKTWCLNKVVAIRANTPYHPLCHNANNC